MKTKYFLLLLVHIKGIRMGPHRLLFVLKQSQETKCICLYDPSSKMCQDNGHFWIFCNWIQWSNDKTRHITYHIKFCLWPIFHFLFLTIDSEWVNRDTSWFRCSSVHKNWTVLQPLSCIPWPTRFFLSGEIHPLLHSILFSLVHLNSPSKSLTYICYISQFWLGFCWVWHLIDNHSLSRWQVGNHSLWALHAGAREVENTCFFPHKCYQINQGWHSTLDLVFKLVKLNSWLFFDHTKSFRIIWMISLGLCQKSFPIYYI